MVIVAPYFLYIFADVVLYLFANVFTSEASMMYLKQVRVRQVVGHAVILNEPTVLSLVLRDDAVITIN